MTPKAHSQAIERDSELRPVVELVDLRGAEGTRGGALPCAVERPASRVLLCTDLADFTSTVERLGDDRARILMRVHNRLLRMCIRLHGGQEVTHTGDGILVSFDAIRGALDCAVEMRAMLAKHNQLHPETLLRIRMGMHAGSPLHEDGRLFGSAVNVTMRVCTAASPEQILVTSEIRELAARCELTRPSFHHRGAFELKGLPAPLELHELNAV